MNQIKHILLITFVLTFMSCSKSLFIDRGTWNRERATSHINSDTSYFLDYELTSREEITKSDPKTIAQAAVYYKLKKDVPDKLKQAVKEGGAVSFISKEYAIKQYRKKLSDISQEYKALTATHSTTNDSLLYIVRDSVLKPQVEGKLIDLKFSKIKSIKVLPPTEAQAIYGSKGIKGAVIID